ncbi:IS5 family transposase [Bacteroides fragilis]|nr:IS5 family transposase [Bacteroides fragilis]UVR50656.1 IS5 family transposase [Bacteroides fragilis]
MLETKERKRKHTLREMINAILYLTKTGCQWRMLPTNFGPWQTVYFYFRKWKTEGVFEELMHHLRQVVRKTKGRDSSPSIGIIDSRSVRTSHHVDRAEYGIDGGKKVKGRKEHIIVDSLGLPMAARVHAANIHDSVGAVDTIKLLQYNFPRLKKIIADGGYRGSLVDLVKGYGWDLSVVLRPKESSKKFQVLPLRWIVERTFSWIENYRRMTTDYEFKTESAEAMLQITFCQIMLKKLIQ